MVFSEKVWSDSKFFMPDALKMSKTVKRGSRIGKYIDLLYYNYNYNYIIIGSPVQTTFII